MAIKYLPGGLMIGLSGDTKPVLPADGLFFIEEDTGRFFKITAGVWAETSNINAATQTSLNLKAPLLSPTFTGTVVIPTPFTLGAVSVLPTGTELNFVDGVTSAIQTQIDAKQATLVSGTNIKTINGSTILGSGDLVVSGGSGISLGLAVAIIGGLNLN